MTTAERITLRFDRLTDGTLVAVHQGVAAIVFSPIPLSVGEFGHRWVLAGGGFLHVRRDRPRGMEEFRDAAAAKAAEALGVHLGVTVDGYEIAP